MRQSRLSVLTLAVLAVGAAVFVSQPIHAKQQQAVIPPGADSLISPTVGLGTEATVLVVLDIECQACVDSVPFYKSLLALPRMDGAKRRLVVLTQRGLVPVSQMLEANSFKPHKMTSGPAAVRELPTAPMVILIGPDGKRKGTWSGRLNAEQEGAVLAAIGS